MSQNTNVHTKKEFLEMLDKSIGDDQVVMWTQNANTIELKKKLNEKRVTVGFAADAFESQDGVGDLMRLRGYLLGVVICDRTLLSEGAKNLVPETKKRKRAK